MPTLVKVVATALCLLLSIGLQAQTGITTINISNSTATSSTTLTTSPSDASNGISASTQYNVNYGQGNDISVSSYIVSGITYDSFLAPDTLILQRTQSSRLVNIWFTLQQINTGPNPDELDLDPTEVPEADAIYLSNTLNAGYDNILVNDDDLASSSIQVQTERVDVIWYSGIQTSTPGNAVFPVIERGGNDNIAIAAITSLDANGNPASYGTLVGIASSDWPGTGQTFNNYLILRRQTVGQDPIPLLNIGTLQSQTAQTVQGVAVSFTELGISADQSIFGYSLFASDVEGVGGAPAIAAGVDLTDIATFPTTTLSSVSGLDLVAGVSAAVASDDNLIETVGPGGYKAALATWLKANDGAFVTSGGAASTEGNNVGFWEDQSVGNHDFSTFGTAPTFRSTTSTINFNPTVDFIENVERGLTTPNNSDYNDKAVNDGFQRKSLNIAFRTNANDITTKQQLFEEGGGTNGLGVYIRNGSVFAAAWNRGNTAEPTAPWNDGTPTSFISTPVVANTEYILTFEMDGDNTGLTGTMTAYLNGQSFGSLSSVGLLFNHTGSITFADGAGSRYDDNTTNAASFDGEISEFIYCNEPGSFPLTQRNRIESYLAIKYGITLDQSTPINYVNSSGNTIFDTTNPASIGGYLEYNNDIAGIGRDDDSELIQLQSKSENTGSVVTIGRSTAINNDDTWLIWGNDGGVLTESSLVSSPDTIKNRLERVWRAAEENEIGVTDVSFDLTGLGLGTNASDFSLLIANTSSGADFSNATVVTGGTFNGDVITFPNIDLEDGQYFTLGTAFFFCTPGNYDDGAIVWLRADMGVTSATEGGSVTAWDDQTPSDYDGSNITSPIYRATTQLFNDNPNVDFSTGSTGISLPIVDGLNNDESISKKFSVVFRTGDDITTKQVIYEQGGATRGLNLYIQSGVLHLSAWNQASDGTGSPWNTGTIATVNTSAIATDTEYIVTFDYDGNDAITGTVTGYLNGTSFGTPLSNIGRLYAHTDAIGLGDENSASRYADGTTSGAASFDGFIPEFVYYNQPTSYLSTDRNRVESNLAIKYGITLDQTSATNYTRSDGTTIWNGTTNATYNNDIAGIGRDDDACLDQKQSQSENSGSIVKMGLGTIEATNADNANSFSDDGDFLVWGSDGDFADQANANTSDVPGSVTERLERIWKVQDTGTTDATTITFDLTGLGYGTTVSDFQLIVSNSATMASGTTFPAASYDVGNNTVTFSGVDLTDGQFFTLGTARTACGPGGILTNLSLWLRADIGTSTTVNGADVSSWVDQGLSNDADGSPGDIPSYVSNSINFNPSLDFDDTNTEQLAGSAGLNTVGYYLVVNPDDNLTSASTEQALIGFNVPPAATDNFGGLILGSATGAFTGELVTHAIGGTTTRWRRGITQTTLGSLVAGDSYLFGIRDNSGGTSTEMSVNGLEQADLVSGSFLTSADVDYEIGSYISTNAFNTAGHFDGQIAEVISYSVRPTDVEHNRIQSYLAIKYGITLSNSGGGDAGDYTSADGTLIWDASDYSAHHNDVAGIGRSDDGCFIQKQSSSANSDDILTVGLGNVAATNALNLNSFDDDDDYLVWGNDDGATAQASANTVDVPGIVAERMSRVWRVNDNGAVGETELQFDLASLGYGSNADDFRLIISDSPTMASGTLVAGGTFNGDVLSFSGIDLTDGQYFTLGTALTTCGPGGVNTNLALWVRADLQVFSDAGSTAATDGGTVQQWNDQSSPADNISEVDLGGSTPVLPTFETNEINFNPVLRFQDPNSSNGSYMESGSNSVSGDMTLISVFSTGQNDGSQGDFVNSPALIGASETSGTADYALGMESGKVWVNANTSTGFDAETSATFNDQLPHIALATRTQSSGAITIFMEGLSSATGTGSTAALSDPNSFGIGNHSDGDVQAQFGGDIAESIVFSSVLTGEEQSRVETYLAIKYGLTISDNRNNNGSSNELISGVIREGDYVAADGGVIWDYLNQGSTYYNDIFGIGRDDLSCLDQTQSKSENTDAMVTFNYPSGFTTDDSFLISGNDNAPIEEPNNKERPATINSRLNREWRVQETGTVGSIELTYDLSGVTGTPLGDNNLNLVRLMVDDDGDFTTGVTLISPSSIDGGSQTVTFDVDFTDGQYYTLGSIEVEALPITLIAFDARPTSDHKVEVSWTTAQELNNAFFTVERSRDGRTFEVVGNVEGAGNSVNLINYEYLDSKPLSGVSFYRLKQTDYNGEFSTSQLVRVRVSIPDSPVHRIVPNPVRKGDRFSIEYPVASSHEVRVLIVNSQGVVMTNQNTYLTPNNSLIELSSEGFASGLYFVQIADPINLNKVTLKLIIK